MYYVMKWGTTRYYLVGPFADDLKAYRWGEAHAEPGEPYTGWDVVDLVDPTQPPLVLDPGERAPPEPEPLHLTLHPTADVVTLERREMWVRPWYGHTNNGTPVVAFVAGVAPRPLEPGEAPSAYQGPEAVAREMRNIPPSRSRKFDLTALTV